MNMSDWFDPGAEVPRLADFEGGWSVTRDIRDRLAGTHLRFRGQARFEQGAGGLRYSEVGELFLPQGGPLRSQRSFIFREKAAGIDVHFDDGRYFHTVPQTGVTARHHCDPDIYDVLYDFVSWPDWTTLWTVRGPRKDYEMFTRFSPAALAG